MKRFLTLALAAVMLFFAAPQTVVRAAESVAVTVTADKNVAYQGDTVNFTVKLGAVSSLGGLQFDLLVPEGLTIVEESVAVPDGLFDSMNANMSMVPSAQNGYRWQYQADETGYAGTSDLTLLSFSCTVNNDAAYESKSVNLNLKDCFDNTVDMNDYNCVVTPATVSVEKKPVHVTGITLDKNSLSLKDGETATLVATVTPADADDASVKWSSDNTAVATVADGVVTAVKEGTAKITATTVDGGKTAECTVTVSCAHNLTKTDAKAATCTVDGNIEYYTCDKCNKVFSDAAATKEITLASTVIKASGHSVGSTWVTDADNHWKVCSACGEKFEQAAHSFEWVVDKAATEDATGLKHEECNVCHVKRNENTVIDKLDHVHVGITHHAAVKATCMKAGNIEYWTCSSSKCTGKYYSDAKCQIEVTTVVEPIDSENHVKEGTWTMDEEGHSRTCACGATVDEGAHVYTNEPDSTCNMCAYKRFYVVTSGANSSYDKASGKGLTIKVDGEYALFEELKIDGKLVDEKNYTVSEGSTVITFTAAYLNTLADGSHDIEVLYTDGKSAKTSIKLSTVIDTGDDSDDEDEDEDEDSSDDSTNAQDDTYDAVPKTGDTDWMMGVTLLLAGLVTAALAVIIRKRIKITE